MNSLNRYAPYALGILRIVTALIFLAHGTQKLFGFPAPAASGLPPMMSIYWFAGVLELIGGVLLLVGFQTRIVAFIVSGEMAFAYFMSHAPRSLYPVLNGGDAAVLYCFVFLYLVFAGAGAFAIDKQSRA